MEVKKNQLAQEIDIDNNPVNKDIIPEDKDIKEEETTPTPVITEEDIREEIKLIEETNIITVIEDIIEPNPEPIENVEDVPTTTAEAVPVIERPKNTVRYIDGFTF